MMACPDPGVVLDYLERRLAAEQRDTLERHVDACAACRMLLAEVTRGDLAELGVDTSHDGDALDELADLAVIDPDRYTDRTLIDEGGMGRIFRARDRRLDREVAIKEVTPDDGVLAARFHREVMLAARLQHPSIVGIHDAGRWPSGELFYAMELVSGSSLDRVIAGAATLEARLALVPHVIAVADALAYAHERRVIHRDLKPHNVMVGAFGETIVIDWGLAKDLTATAGREPGAPGSAREADAPEAGAERTHTDAATRPRGPGDATHAGAVLGTPAYMAPEQATGAVVDERADVYAIGAILYHVLAGAPPYAGKHVTDVVAAVRRTPPPPLGASVPRDLLAIVERAMAREPAARYPSARELAADLRRFQAGQLVGAHRYTLGQRIRRWVRRHRAAVTVATIAAALLIALSTIGIRGIFHERDRADAEREDAQQHRATAESLLDFILFDLKDKLEPIGRLDLLDAVAEQVIDYYERRSAPRNPSERRKLALAHRDYADVASARGDTVAALAHVRAALALTSELVIVDPAQPTWRRDLALHHERLGDLLRAQGDTVAAVAAYRTMFQLRVRLADEDPRDTGRQHDLAIAHQKLGDVAQRRGDLVAALAEYRATNVIFERLVVREPLEFSRQHDLSLSHERIADVLLAQGDAAAALVAYRAAGAIGDRLLAGDPADVARQRRVMVIHERIGDLLLLQQGDAHGALAEYQRTHAIAERLTARDPSNAGWQRDLFVALVKLGDGLVVDGDLDGALARYRAAVEAADRIARRDPTNTNAQRDLSVGRLKVGELLLERGDAAGALAEIRAGVAIREQLAARDPAHADGQRDLVVGKLTVSAALARQRDRAGAVAELRAALALAEMLAKRDPTNAMWQRDVSICHERIGGLLLATDPAAALAAFRAAKAIRQQLAAGDPASAIAQHDLAVGHDTIGSALLARGDRTGALTEYRAALAIVEKLAARDPTNAQWQADLAEMRSKVTTCCGSR